MTNNNIAKNSAPIRKKIKETKMKTKAKNNIENKLFLAEITPNAVIIIRKKSKYTNDKYIEKYNVYTLEGPEESAP